MTGRLALVVVLALALSIGCGLGHKLTREEAAKVIAVELVKPDTVLALTSPGIIYSTVDPETRAVLASDRRLTVARVTGIMTPADGVSAVVEYEFRINEQEPPIPARARLRLFDDGWRVDGIIR